VTKYRVIKEGILIRSSNTANLLSELCRLEQVLRTPFSHMRNIMFGIIVYSHQKVIDWAIEHGDPNVYDDFTIPEERAERATVLARDFLTPSVRLNWRSVAIPNQNRQRQTPNGCECSLGSQRAPQTTAPVFPFSEIWLRCGRHPRRRRGYRTPAW